MLYLLMYVWLYLRKRRPYLLFWHGYASSMRQKRRRRVLADIMGAYALKSRTYARMKLHVYTLKKIRVAATAFDKKGQVGE